LDETSHRRHKVERKEQKRVARRQAELAD